MKLVSKAVALGLVIGMSACGSGDDDDKGSGSQQKFTPETNVVPETFANSVTTSSDFDAKITEVQGEVSTSGSALKLGDTATAFRAFRRVNDESGEPDLADKGQDFSAFKADLAVGGDCSAQFGEFKEQFESMSDQFADMSSQVDQMGEDFSTAGLATAFYDVTNLDKAGKYAFHFKLVPKKGDGTDGGFGAFFTPEVTVAGGANEDQVVMVFGSVMSFEFEAEGKKTSFNFDTSTTVFADKSAKVVKVGMESTGTSTTPEATSTFSFSGASTLSWGGETPSFEQTFAGSSSQAGGTFDMKTTVTKNSDTQFTMQFDGTVDGTPITKTLTVTKDDSTCKVAAVE